MIVYQRVSYVLQLFSEIVINTLEMMWSYLSISSFRNSHQDFGHWATKLWDFTMEITAASSILPWMGIPLWKSPKDAIPGSARFPVTQTTRIFVMSPWRNEACWVSDRFGHWGAPENNTILYVMFVVSSGMTYWIYLNIIISYNTRKHMGVVCIQDILIC